MLLPPPRTPDTEPTLTIEAVPARREQRLAGAHRRRTGPQIDRQHKVKECVVEGAQIGVRDHARAAGIVDQDVEPALGRPDRVNEAFDRRSILRWGAAGAVTGSGQARDQPVGGLGIAAKGDDDARPSCRKQVRCRRTEAFAAARHQCDPPSSMPIAVIPAQPGAAIRPLPATGRPGSS